MQHENHHSDISPQVVEQAADWLVKINLNDGLTKQEQVAFEKWRNASPEHAAAWIKAESLTNKLHSVPAKLAKHTLQRPVDNERRGALGKLLLLMLALPSGWGAWKFLSPQSQSFHYHTAIGQQETITLDDGSKLSLNTDTIIDVVFDNKQRAVFLRQGEIYIETAKDKADKQRPFIVISSQGMLKALGTRFNVRDVSQKTELTVFEGAVQLTPTQRKHDSLILKEGKQTRFTATGIDHVTAITTEHASWLSGMLLANNMRLADFISELARYYQGKLQCDPRVADLKIAGAFPVRNTEKSLNMLMLTYPVTVVSTLDRYWVTASQE